MAIYSYLSSLSLPRELLHVITIFILAWLALILSRKLIRVFQGFMNTHVKSAEDNRQVNTLARVFRYVATVIISLITIMLALDEIGISVTPILGAAGVVGIAVGFGAQSLVKDYFTGFFLLLENQIRQGDAIEVCGKSGQVEDITLRYVRLRDNEGNVHYIPNGQITLVTNKSCDYAFAVIDISVSYHEDLDKVYDILKSVGDEMQSDTEIGDKMLAPIEIQGIQTLAESTVTIRCRFKTVALEQWSIRRKFLGRVKQAFDTHKIDIPYSQITVNREKYARIT
ncbi:MAG: mechanosensitive ion channel family protein [Gallionella sp.]|nr:mechanosensitive ion channel family protein [Gallionella sp.]MDD4959275.1 mechanosensitive ion channel family protein [Gallionella sp.]